METISYLVLAAAISSAPLVAQTPADPDPPRTGHLAERALRLADYRWIRRSAAHADVYVRAGSRAEALLPTIVTKVDAAIDTDLAWLGERFAGPRLRVFLVGTREELRPLLSATPGGHAATDEGAAFMIGNDSIAPPLRHELMHLLSWRLWGTPATAPLSEGVATSVAGHCGGMPVPDIAAALDREHKLVSLDTLWHHFTYSAEVGAMYYVEGASLVEYIDRTYGRKKLRAFWPIGAWTDSQQRLGVDIATLERDWRASIARHRAPAASWAHIFRRITAQGCE